VYLPPPAGVAPWVAPWGMVPMAPKGFWSVRQLQFWGRIQLGRGPVLGHPTTPRLLWQAFGFRLSQPRSGASDDAALVEVNLRTFTTRLAFDLWRNCHIKNVVLFEENSILPLPECLESSGVESVWGEVSQESPKNR